jgi:hypothetical protein
MTEVLGRSRTRDGLLVVRRAGFAAGLEAVFAVIE